MGTIQIKEILSALDSREKSFQVFYSYFSYLWVIQDSRVITTEDVFLL